jgi:hypothetical protein
MGTLSLEFMNGRGSGLGKAAIQDDDNEKFYRVTAVLETNVDLRDFPWDSHKLPITFEDTLRTQRGDADKRGLVLVVEQPDAPGTNPPKSLTGYGRGAKGEPDVAIVGWQLKGGTPEVADHVYPYPSEISTPQKPVYEQYSRYSYTLELGRLKGIASVKTFMPVVCFLIVVLISLLGVIEKLDARLTMNTAMLMASVMFHVNISNQLPPLGYLTKADKVLIATYSTVMLNLVFAIIMTRLMQAKKEMLARRIRQLCFCLVPSYAIFAYEFALLSPSGDM